MSKDLHVYRKVEVPRTEKVRWVIYQWEEVSIPNSNETMSVSKEVWSTRAVDFYDDHALAQTQQQVAEETARRNGAKARKSDYKEAMALMAQLRELDRQGVRL